MTKGLKILLLKYTKNPIIPQTNVNFIRINYQCLRLLEILISGTKIDYSFPTSQCWIDGFLSPYRLHRNRNEGVALVYFKNNIITKSLKTIDLSIEAIFIEINLRRKKQLTRFTYNPSKYLLEFYLIKFRQMCSENRRFLISPGNKVLYTQ